VQDFSSRSFGKKSSLKRRWKASTAGKEKEGEEETGFPKTPEDKVCSVLLAFVLVCRKG